MILNRYLAMYKHRSNLFGQQKVVVSDFITILREIWESLIKNRNLKFNQCFAFLVY